MEPEVVKKLFRKVYEATKETSTLYDLSESDKILLTQILMSLQPHLDMMSIKLLSRLLRASAHILERNEEIGRELFKDMKEK